MAILLLVLATALWSGNFVVGRAISDTLSPLWLNALRWLVAALALLPLLGPSLWQHRRDVLEQWRGIALLALLGVVLFNSALYAALQQIPASTAGLIFAATPFVAALIESAVTRRRPRAVVLLAAPLAAIGVFLAQPPAASALDGLLRLAPMLGVVVIWALYTVLLRHCARRVPVTASFLAQVLVGLAVLLPAAALASPAPALSALQGSVMGAILYLGLGAAAVAFLAWQTGVRHLGADVAAPFINLIPVFSVAISALTLGERLSGKALIGAACVLASITLVCVVSLRVPGRTLPRGL